MSVDNCLVKTHDKGIMMETFDQIVDELPVTTSLLEDYSCYEMELLMEEENTTDNPANPNSQLTQSPINNTLPTSGIVATVSALDKEVNDNEKERNNGQPSQPETVLDKEKDRQYNDDELEKLKGQEVIHTNAADNSAENVRLGDKFVNSKGIESRTYVDSSGKLKADRADAFSNKETL